jgi:glycosyltransferase involved in cell wall biosynthesis
LNIVAEADCFIFPSRGEGFGLTPIECMATGLPTIVPNAHGITEYFDKKYMYEAKVETTCSGIYSKYKGQNVGNMVVCDVKQLRSQMRYVYEHQEQAKEKGKQASEYVKQWAIQNTSSKLIEAIEKLRQQQPKKRLIKNVLEVDAI